MSLLQVSALSKSFGANRAVDQVGFDVDAGEMLALIGPNGAGKSTVFNLLNGQLRADSGSIRLGHDNLSGKTPRDIFRLGVGRSFQVAETFASLSVIENVQLALLAADRKLFSLWQPAAGYKRPQAMQLLQQVGMMALAERQCSVLAYGDVKRVELAIALASGPRLMLMDEPTAGMAPQERVALMELVRTWVTERRLAVLFTEHSMDVVFGFADRIVVMARGKVIAQGTPAEVRRDQQVQAVYFGGGPIFGVDEPSASSR